jgi:acyl carrier protein
VQALAALDALRRESGAALAWAVTLPGAAPLRLVADALAEAAEDGEPGWTSVAWGLPAPDAEDAAEAGEAAARALRRVAAAGSGASLVVSAGPLPAGWSRADELPLPAASAAERAGGVGLYPRPSLRVEYAAPRNDLEVLVVRLWQELLGVARVGIHDSFLDLGGDSLLATRLVARLRDALHLDLPVRLFFERSTVAELAAAVEEIRGRQAALETREMVGAIQGLSEEELEREIQRLEDLVGSEELANG